MDEHLAVRDSAADVVDGNLDFLLIQDPGAAPEQRIGEIRGLGAMMIGRIRTDSDTPGRTNTVDEVT